MRPFWRRTAPARTELDGPPDLLAEQAAKELSESVRQRRALTGAPAPPSAVVAPADADVLVWTDRDDVYRPHLLDAAEFALLVGAVDPRPFRRAESRCWIRSEALRKIYAHLRSNTGIELGGLLVGEACHDPGRDLHCVIIEDALPAAGGEGTETTFSYTEATWQALSPQLDALPESWTMLGSYHSHPGMGVFLSSTDLETQRGVFYHDWQVALVIDPKSNEIGFFFGAEGHPCPHWQAV